MATTFLNRFHREKSERQGLVAADSNVNTKSKKKDKEKGNSGGKAADGTNDVGIMSAPPTHSAAAFAASTDMTNSVTEKSDATATKTSQQQPARQQRRYIRSATAASVTQLLSESYSSLLQRFRRHPSERPDKSQNQQQQHQHQKRNRDIKSTANDEYRDTSKTPTNFDNNNSKSVKSREKLVDNCEAATDNSSHRNSMCDRRRYYGRGGGAGSSYYAGGGGTSTGRYQKSATAVSALDRLRSNLSPVTSYYKPLMRSFGRRGDDDVSI